MASILTGEPRVSLDSLRTAVREVVERTSARAVARDVGLTHPALLAFVDGTEPRDSTLRKLLDWYVRDRARAAGEVDSATVAAALAILLRHVPARKRDRVRAEVLAALEQGSRAAGVDVPGWVRRLK